MNRNRLFTAILTCIVLFIFTAPGLASDVLYRVMRVVDGDTIVVDYQGKPEEVCLLFVNTPEPVHPDTKELNPLGKAAYNFTKAKLSGKEVGLEFEGIMARNIYGRMLAYVIVDGQNVNLELVRQGLSCYYREYGRSQKYDKEFQEAEKSARQSRLNIWGGPAPSKLYLQHKKKKSGFYVKGSPPPESQDQVRDFEFDYLHLEKKKLKKRLY